MGIGAAWFGISRRLFSIGDGGTMISVGVFDIEGGWNRLLDTWLEARSLDTLFATGFLVQD